MRPGACQHCHYCQYGHYGPESAFHTGKDPHTGNQKLLTCELASMEARPSAAPCLLSPLSPLRRRRPCSLATMARVERMRRGLTPGGHAAARPRSLPKPAGSCLCHVSNGREKAVGKKEKSKP